MGGEAGKHRSSKRPKSQFPTSAARERFIKKRVRSNKTRVTSLAGKALEPKWAAEFVAAGYKYVFLQVPMKGNVQSRMANGFPGDPKKEIPAHLSKRTPVGDIIFGNDLDDLNFFDSKRRYSSPFSIAQKMVYPIINKSGGMLLPKNGEQLLNLSTGQMIDLNGRRINPGTAYVGFSADLSAVASGQVDLNSLLKARRGELFPPSSSLDLEDSRMITEGRARYRGGNGQGSNQRDTNKERGLTKRGTKKDPVEVRQQPRPEKVDPFKKGGPKSKTFDSKVAPPKLTKRFIPKRVRVPVNLIKDVILDYTIGKTIRTLEGDLNQVKQELILSLYSENVYKTIKPDIDIVLSLEKSDAKKITWHQGFIQVDWEVLLRKQDSDAMIVSFDPEEIEGDIVWLFKNAFGEPGPVTIFEGVNYIKHEIVAYESHTRNREKLKADKVDKKLLHEPHQDFILVWDKDVHRIAQMYRKLSVRAIYRLNLIFDKIKQTIATLPSANLQAKAELQLNSTKTKIEEALNVYDFRMSKTQTKQLISGVGGHFANRITKHRIEIIFKEIESLREILAETTDFRILSRKQKQNQRDLLSMFLEQSLDNL